MNSLGIYERRQPGRDTHLTKEIGRHEASRKLAESGVQAQRRITQTKLQTMQIITDIIDALTLEPGE